MLLRLTSRRTIQDAAGLAALAVLTALIWATPLLPLQDYYEWTFQASLVRQIIADESFLSDFYRLHWSAVPNLASSLLLTLLNFVTTSEFAGRIYLTAYTLLFVVVWYAASVSDSPGSSYRWLGLLFVWNYFFFLGFLGFMLGTGVLLLAVWALIRVRHRSSVVWMSTVAGFSFILHFCHFVALAVFLAASLVESFVHRRLGRPSETIAVGTLVVGSLATGLVAMADVVSFGEVLWTDSFSLLVRSNRNVIFAMHRLAPFEHGVPLTVVNVACLGVVLIAVVSVLRDFRQNAKATENVVWLGLGWAALSFVLPIQSVGDLYVLGPRLFLVGILLVLCFGGTRRRIPFLEWSAPMVGLILVSSYMWQFAAFQDDAVRMIEQTAPEVADSGSVVVARGYAEEFDKRPLTVLSGAVRPMIHAERLFDLRGTANPKPTFETGLVRNTGRPDRAPIEEFRRAVTTQTRLEAVERAARSRSSWSKHIKKIVIWGNEETISLFEDGLRRDYMVDRRGKYWGVLVKRE